MIISEELKKELRIFAQRYETSAFTNDDPSRILRRYTELANIETAAFIAAILAFGRRDQFLQKINLILDTADKYGGPASWLKNGIYQQTFIPHGADTQKKFYRFYSYADMIDLFDALRKILSTGTLGEYFSKRKCVPLAPEICAAFDGCAVVPHGKDTANKRINMFLRWMVRKNSPVDLGIWDWYSPADLIIPLDTHVIQEAVKLGLLPPKCGGTAKTATLLTETLKQIWPEDPCKGDFALFGLGVDSGHE